MSALIRQSHANNQDPLWASSQGGEDIVTDKITINPGGAINVGEGGFMTLASSINSSTGIVFNKAVDGSTITQFQQGYIGGVAPNQAVVLINEASDYDSLQVGNLVVYGENIGFGATDYLSLQGTGTTIGMSYGDNNTRTAFMDLAAGPTLTLNPSCIGPVPVTFSGVPVSVGPVPTAPAPFGDFFISNPYPTVAGQEYDFACRGVITLSSGTPDATLDDIFVVKVFIGGATTGTQNYIFNPNAGTWYVRDRLICETPQASIVVSVQNVQRGTSTAVYSCNMVMGDIVRVK